MPRIICITQEVTIIIASGYLIKFVSGSDVDYVCMVDTNGELLPDHWELTTASHAMAASPILFFVIVAKCNILN